MPKSRSTRSPTRRVSFEGLIQADGNWFKNNVADLNAPNVNNGQNSEFELRRAEWC